MKRGAPPQPKTNAVQLLRMQRRVLARAKIGQADPNVFCYCVCVIRLSILLRFLCLQL